VTVWWVSHADSGGETIHLLVRGRAHQPPERNASRSTSDPIVIGANKAAQIILAIPELSSVSREAPRDETTASSCVISSSTNGTIPSAPGR